MGTQSRCAVRTPIHALALLELAGLSLNLHPGLHWSPTAVTAVDEQIYRALAAEVLNQSRAAAEKRSTLLWKQIRSDAAAILVCGVTDPPRGTCRLCGQHDGFYDVNGQRTSIAKCISCRALRAEEKRQEAAARAHRCTKCSSDLPVGAPARICDACRIAVQRQSKELAALRRSVAAIEMATFKCSRCNEKMPPILFPPAGRVCFPCKVEIGESLIQSLRERLSCEAGNRTVEVRRHQARGEYAGKRLQQAIEQSDGTLSVAVVGRLFADAEGKPCPYCGDYMSRATKSLDHMVPLNKGGVHGVVNMIICCKRCNTAKRDKDFGDWLSKLKEPYASVMAAEYEQRYGAKPSQSLLQLKYASEPSETVVQ